MKINELEQSIEFKNFVALTESEASEITDDSKEIETIDEIEKEESS